MTIMDADFRDGSGGILYVFPAFHFTTWVQKIRCSATNFYVNFHPVFHFSCKKAAYSVHFQWLYAAFLVCALALLYHLFTALNVALCLITWLSYAIYHMIHSSNQRTSITFIKGNPLLFQ